MHILLVTNTQNGIWGADRDWINLVNSFTDEGIKVTWAGIEGTDVLKPYVKPQVVKNIINTNLTSFDYLLYKGSKVKRSKWLWSKILIDHLLRSRKPLAILDEKLKNQKIDLVVSNTAVATLGAIYAKTRRLPHVWFIKEHLDPSVKDCLAYAKWISRLSKSVVVPSQSVANSFKNRQNIEVIHDGNEVEKILASRNTPEKRVELLKKLNLPENRTVVAQIGGFNFWKGQQITAEAFVKLSKEFKDPIFSLLFLGDGLPAFKDELKKILSEAPTVWQDAVRFVKFEVDDFSYIDLADIVIQPSVGPDSFPNALREAMILGKATIGSSSGGIVEIIKDKETGLLVPPADESALAEAIKELVINEEKRHRIANEAQLYAVDYFDIKKRKQDFIKLLKKHALQK